MVASSQKSHIEVQALFVTIFQQKQIINQIKIFGKHYVYKFVLKQFISCRPYCFLICAIERNFLKYIMNQTCLLIKESLGL